MSKLFDGKIKQRTFIKAPPEKVYDTITSARDWDAFFTTGMQLEPHAGGKCSFAWKDWGPDFYDITVPGKVIEASRPSQFKFKWGPEGKETTVNIDLEAKFGGTIVTLTEHGYEDTPQARAMILECAAGWGEAITLLKFYIEKGIVYSGPSK
jgi:uncharacterized protein YndB with AHSA1/START domain